MRRELDTVIPGWRLAARQEGQGYRWVLVDGVATFIDGECTGKTPGKLLRGGSAG